MQHSAQLPEDYLCVLCDYVYFVVNLEMKTLIVMFCEMHTCFVLHGIQPAWFVDLIGALVKVVSRSCVQ